MYLSFRLFTNFRLKSSIPTSGSSSGSMFGCHSGSARTDTKPSPSRTRRIRSGFGPKKVELGELLMPSPAGLLLPASRSISPTISPSSISECSESVCSSLMALQSTVRRIVSRPGECFGESRTVSVESGGSSIFIDSSFSIWLSTWSFKSSLPISSSEAGEPVGSNGSYFSATSSESAARSSFSPSVGENGSYILFVSCL